MSAAPGWHTVHIAGIALWSPALPGWDAAARAFRGEPPQAADATDALAPSSPQGRPLAARLAPNERRRAPDGVRVALEVAEAAVAMSGLEAAALAYVFTSAHGDLGVVDALCGTLAQDPLLLSPTRFHHSVHNAASGYWSMASGSRAPGTAVAGYTASFASGWLEAATLAATDERPVLLVGFDTDARGPLRSVNGSRGLLGVALVLAPPGLAPEASPTTPAAPGLCVHWRLHPKGPAATPPASAAAQALADNAMADALPLMEALAAAMQGQARVSRSVHCTLGEALSLELRVEAVPG
jgi:hypothetical protein